jgi:hypothetical protein
MTSPVEGTVISFVPELIYKRRSQKARKPGYGSAYYQVLRECPQSMTMFEMFKFEFWYKNLSMN